MSQLLLAALAGHFVASVSLEQPVRRHEVDGLANSQAFLASSNLQEASRRSGLKLEYPFYHTSLEIQSEARRLAASCNGLGSFWSVNESGVSIDIVRVRATTPNPANKVFIMFGEHSRELISPESGLALLRMLCGADPSRLNLVSTTLQDSDFEFVLNANPRSREQVEQGSYCIRTNPDGVDLNRNWDEKWIKDEATFQDDVNPGPHPFSEPETRIFKQLVMDYKPTTFLTVHSGTRGLYMPWAYDTEHLAVRNQRAMMEVLREVDAKHCQCPFGAAGKEVGYSCPGTCIDWVYDQMKAPYAFAFEIFVDPSQDADLKQRWDEKAASASLLQEGSIHLAHQNFSKLFHTHTSDFVQFQDMQQDALHRGDGALVEDSWSKEAACFATYNPLTEELYKSTVENWAEAYLNMAQLVVSHMSKKL